MQDDGATVEPSDALSCGCGDRLLSAARSCERCDGKLNDSGVRVCGAERRELSGREVGVRADNDEPARIP